jgi:diaminohydroxyphosphoribosylaminopyrimidine deaminase/5-amino-6-(5-phosphoribosylamino)uracil reductase
VSDGRIVGEGFHPRAGMPHAEVFALADAGDDARGATAYVTLEPCAHHGKTPPCVDALLASGITHVVIGMRDPHAVASGGVERLRSAGVEVDIAPAPAPFAALNAGWLKRLATGIPFVTVKSGVSLDARIAFALGERASITGPSGREVTRRLRARTDAVLVSAATVTADDPALTVRDAGGHLAERQPLRVVLVREDVPASDARVFTDGAAATIVLASDLARAEALASLPDSVQIVRWSASDGLLGAFRALGDHGVGDVLVEAGARLLSAMWDEGVIDEYVTVTAGGMGGMAVPVYLGAGDADGDSLRPRMRPLEAGIVGDVSVTVWGACEASDVHTERT